jgi:hypothetical protein
MTTPNQSRSIIKNHVFSSSLTPTLTASYVYSDSVIVNGINYHTFHVNYTCGEDGKKLSLIIQFSKDDENTDDSTSIWTTYGVEAISTGTGTFTATTYEYVGTTHAVAYPFHIDLTNATGYKVRVGIKDNATTHGTVSVTQFSNDR